MKPQEQPLPQRNQFTAAQQTWLLALESGDYQQDFNYLHTEHGHCCLGVADAVLGLHEKDKMNLLSTFHLLDLYDRNGAFERPAKCNNQPARHLWDGKNHDLVCLTNMNDSRLFTFREIAAFIRARPWAVFTNFDIPMDADRGGAQFEPSCEQQTRVLLSSFA